MSYSFKTVFITGVANGIGRGIADYFIKKGWRVAGLDINKESGRKLEDKYGRDSFVFFEADVSDENSVKSSVASTLKKFGCLDALVNNAGIASPYNGTSPEDMDIAKWKRVIDVNLTGSMLCVKYAVPALRKSKGSIVNISSTRALQSEKFTEAYSASKGALLALTHSLAVSLAHEVRVNTVLPGWIETRHMQENSSALDSIKYSEEDISQHPAGRVGLPEDIASMVYFLCSDEAGFITGQKFVVDGGMTTKMIYAE